MNDVTVVVSVLVALAAKRVSKLEPEPARPRYFITEPCMGYRFESEQEAGAR